jgi:hemerythrin-like metal-binding protein
MEIQMALFNWYKKYSVDNEELDEHHKKIFYVFNRLYDDCLGHEKPHCIDPLIEEMISYTNYHFSAEEQHMKNLGYNDIDKHIDAHRGFTQRILQLQQTADKDECETTKELIALLGDWLLHHIIEEDKKYAIYLKK